MPDVDISWLYAMISSLFKFDFGVQILLMADLFPFLH